MNEQTKLRRRKSAGAVHRAALDQLVRARRYVARQAYPALTAASSSRVTADGAYDALVKLEALLDELRGLADSAARRRA